MYNFMNALANSTSLAVQIENIKAAFLQEPGLDRVHTDIAPQVIEQFPAINIERPIKLR